MKVTMPVLNMIKSIFCVALYLIMCKDGHNFLKSVKEYDAYVLERYVCSRCGWHVNHYIPKDVRTDGIKKINI